MLNEKESIFFILGTKSIINTFRKDRTSPLLADPFEFYVQQFNSTENTLKIVQRTIGYEAFEEINVDEYLFFHGYLNGTLELFMILD